MREYRLPTVKEVKGNRYSPGDLVRVLGGEIKNGLSGILTSTMEDGGYQVLEADGKIELYEDISDDFAFFLVYSYFSFKEIKKSLNLQRRLSLYDAFLDLSQELPIEKIKEETVDSVELIEGIGTTYLPTGKKYPLDFSEYHKTWNFEDIKQVDEYLDQEGNKICFVKDEKGKLVRMLVGNPTCRIDKKRKTISWTNPHLARIQPRHLARFLAKYVNTKDPKQSMLTPSSPSIALSHKGYAGRGENPGGTIILNLDGQYTVSSKYDLDRNKTTFHIVPAKGNSRYRGK